ncbi:MAG: CHAT domain-containing protein [Planctomycetota bacterium]|jgi:tetratricopeptide (TPR) repeat protein
MTIPTDNATLLRALRELPPEGRAARLRETGRPDALLLELADELARMATADPDEAVALADVLAETARGAGHELAEARCRRAAARALAYAGRFDEALAACDAAAGIAERAGLEAEAGRARLASMHALAELGRLEAAESVGLATRQRFVELGERPLAARADINLGVVYQRRDEPRSAVACFERARADLADEPLVVGSLDNNRGEALVALNDFEAAERAFEDALGAYERAEAPIAAAIAEGNLADVAARQGHLQAALEHFEQARRRFETNRSPVHLARLLAEQAEAKAILGLPAEALAEYEAVLPDLDTHGLALEAARARSGMGRVLVRLGRASEAETALAAAATGFDELGHGTARAKIDLVRAELLAANGRLGEARQLALRALAALADRPAEAVAARHVLALLGLRAGDDAVALAELNTAVTLAEQLDLPPLRADLLHTRGLALRRLGRLDEAIEDLTGAMEGVERVRGTLQAQRLRAAWLGDRAAVYEQLVDALLDRGGDDAVAHAFAVAEKAKSRSLLEQIQSHVPIDAFDDDCDPRGRALREELGRLQAELNGLYSRLAESDAAGGAAREGASLQDAIRRREQQLDALRARLTITSGVAGLLAPTATLEQVRRRIAADERLVEYMAVGDDVVAFVVGPDGVLVRRVPGALAAVTGPLARLRFQVDRALRPGAATSPRFPRMVDDARAELAALHDLLVRPLADGLPGAGRLTVVPHGPMHLVPFHALHDGESHLVERCAVRTAPSASILLLGDDPVDAVDRAIVLGVADEIAPGIADEAVEVARALAAAPDDTLVGPAATVEAFRRHCGKASVVHLAAHGRFAPESPMSSGLRLADRWLTVRDIYALRLDCELVTLSGCETGVNSVTAGDELMGLLRGFFAAGARSVLASLWRADDASASEFMRRFYARWGKGADRADAVRDVQLELMRQWPHPAHWAPFILVGS